MFIELTVQKLDVRFLYITCIMSEHRISHKISLFYFITTICKIKFLTLKRLGEGGEGVQSDTPPVVFSKNISFKESF